MLRNLGKAIAAIIAGLALFALVIVAAIYAKADKCYEIADVIKIGGCK
jgi:hypothetical protein